MNAGRRLLCHGREINLKVLHIQREVPHYKKRFFEALSSSGDFDYTLVLVKSSLAIRYPGSVVLEELANSGINCLEIEANLINLLGKTIEIYPALLRYILENRPDVIMEGGLIFFGSKYIDACICYLLRWILCISFVGGWSASALSKRGPVYHIFLRFKQKLVFGYFDSWVTYGELAKDVLIERGVHQRDIFIAYNSLDTQKLAKIKRQLESTRGTWKERLLLDLGICEENKIILFLSRITFRKRLDLAIKALPRILQSEPCTVLVVVGDGDDVNRNKALARRIGVAERVVFVDGIYNDEKIAKFFLLSDVIVYPGWISLSTQFAMMMGKPFICAPLGNEIEYALNEKNCLYFHPDDAEDLATKVVVLLQDASMQARFGQASKELVATKANIHNKIDGYRKAIKYAHVK